MRAHRFHPRALDEYEAAAAWYADRSVEAANSFLESIDAGIDSVCEVPLAWPLWPGRVDARRRVLRRVPYSVIYVVDRDDVVIVAIAHHKQRPGYWMSRIR